MIFSALTVLSSPIKVMCIKPEKLKSNVPMNYDIVYSEGVRTVTSMRIPKGLRKKMNKPYVNWSELIRRLVEEAVARYEAEEPIKQIRRTEGCPRTPLGTVSRWLGSDRESH
jgi:hypothetical protein